MFWDFHSNFVEELSCFGCWWDIYGGVVGVFNRKGVFNIDMVGWGCLIGRGYLILIWWGGGV